MEVLLIRHAETAWNAEGRWQGQTDVPLSARGRAQADAARPRLQRWMRQGNAYWVTSDLERAEHTLRTMMEGVEVPVARDPGLREMDLGAWCGMLNADVRRRFPEQIQALAAGEDVRFGGSGELASGFRRRVYDAVDRAVQEARARGVERVAVMSHGGVIRAIMTHVLGLPAHERQWGVENTSFTRIVQVQKATSLVTQPTDFVLRSYNEHPSHVARFADVKTGFALGRSDADADLVRAAEYVGVPHERFARAPGTTCVQTQTDLNKGLLVFHAAELM